LDRHCLRFVELSLRDSRERQRGGTLRCLAARRGTRLRKAPDSTTLLIPDAPGNNRLTRCRTSSTPAGRAAFSDSGSRRNAQVNGKARLIDEAGVLLEFRNEKRTPKLVIEVKVEHVYLHCAKALMRSKLWDPASRVERSVLPTMGQMLNEQTGHPDPSGDSGPNGRALQARPLNHHSPGHSASNRLAEGHDRNRAPSVTGRCDAIDSRGHRRPAGRQPPAAHRRDDCRLAVSEYAGGGQPALARVRRECGPSDRAAMLYQSVPSSALQINIRWDQFEALEADVLEASWELGAWDLRRIEAPGCERARSPARAYTEMQTSFGLTPQAIDGERVFVADVPDADELVGTAARAGYVHWEFRPTWCGLWKDLAADVTLEKGGYRNPLCRSPPARTNPAMRAPSFSSWGPRSTDARSAVRPIQLPLHLVLVQRLVVRSAFALLDEAGEEKPGLVQQAHRHREHELRQDIGGVTIAATTNAPTMKYGRASRSFSTVTTPARTRMISTIGISNVTPNARNIVITKLKYASMSGAGVIDFGAKSLMKRNTVPKTK
jgi:predicted pyridoxine 5'-phosphate oxidase superfamily flavin-nucleotide-binding protein